MRAGWYIFVLLALAACARNGPPAPVVSGGGYRPGVAQPMVPHPDQVTVQPGETLYGVARRYGVPVRSLIEANSLSPPYKLTAGRKLALPQVRQHIVQPGETLYGISRLYGVDTTTLAQGNGIGPPYVVRVGQSLALPAPVESRGKPPVIQATAPAPLPPAAAPPAAVTRSELPPPAPLPPAPPQRLAAEAPPPPPEKPAEPAPPPPAAAPPPAAPPEQVAIAPPPPASSSAARSFIWPVHGRLIASFGAGEGGTHNDGINIAAPAGTPVLAADAGVVAYAGNELRGYGNLILIKHANGWMTAYAHNAALMVKRGDHVKRGQTIARIGATGAVSEPQLHFEIRHGTRAMDPAEYLPQPAATASSG
jgi:murein DD-endopeptidase MepM/ murein hydrolase activator NlpD